MSLRRLNEGFTWNIAVDKNVAASRGGDDILKNASLTIRVEAEDGICAHRQEYARIITWGMESSPPPRCPCRIKGTTLVEEARLRRVHHSLGIEQ